MKEKIRIYRDLVLRKYQIFKERRALNKLSKHKQAKIGAIGKALQEVLTQSYTNKELKVFELIEQRRSFLLQSRKEISVIDYGAGKSGQKRTQEEMRKGVKATAKIADVTRASKPELWAKILFKMISQLKPSSCVELGTCLGISASYISASLKMNGKGKLFSLEGSPEIARIAKQTLKSLSLSNNSVIIGPFQNTLNDVLEASKPIDFFFNDGHHDYDAVLNYYNKALPYMAEESVMVFDDISWSEGMRKAWKEIENDNRVNLSIDLKTIGIVFIGKQSNQKKKISISVFNEL